MSSWRKQKKNLPMFEVRLTKTAEEDSQELTVKTQARIIVVNKREFDKELRGLIQALNK